VEIDCIEQRSFVSWRLTALDCISNVSAPIWVMATASPGLPAGSVGWASYRRRGISRFCVLHDKSEMCPFVRDGEKKNDLEMIREVTARRRHSDRAAS
jgi:hypothetical protein